MRRRHPNLCILVANFIQMIRSLRLCRLTSMPQTQDRVPRRWHDITGGEAGGSIPHVNTFFGSLLVYTWRVSSFSRQILLDNEKGLHLLLGRQT